jgi:hypothetical protein
VRCGVTKHAAEVLTPWSCCAACAGAQPDRRSSSMRTTPGAHLRFIARPSHGHPPSSPPSISTPSPLLFPRRDPCDACLHGCSAERNAPSTSGASLRRLRGVLNSNDIRPRVARFDAASRRLWTTSALCDHTAATYCCGSAQLRARLLLALTLTGIAQAALICSAPSILLVRLPAANWWFR